FAADVSYCWVVLNFWGEEEDTQGPTGREGIAGGPYFFSPATSSPDTSPEGQRRDRGSVPALARPVYWSPAWRGCGVVGRRVNGRGRRQGLPAAGGPVGGGGVGPEVGEDLGRPVGVADGVEGGVADELVAEHRHGQAVQADPGHRPLLGQAVGQPRL